MISRRVVFAALALACGAGAVAIIIGVGGRGVATRTPPESNEHAMKTIEEVIAGAKRDFEICNGAYLLLSDACRRAQSEPAHEVERDVILTWDASGVIGNGGFAFLLETDFAERDPDFRLVVESLDRIGATACRDAFHEFLGHFPNRKVPEDPIQRLEQFQAKLSKEQRHDLSRRYWRGKPDYQTKLKDYILKNRATIDEVIRQRYSSAPGSPPQSR